MRLIAKIIRISQAKFHCNKFTAVQDIHNYARLIFLDTLYIIILQCSDWEGLGIEPPAVYQEWAGLGIEPSAAYSTPYQMIPWQSMHTLRSGFDLAWFNSLSSKHQKSVPKTSTSF